MVFPISTVATSGQTLRGTIRKWTPSTNAHGDKWNDATGAFDSNPQPGQQFITLTESVAADQFGYYTGATSADLETYTGWVKVYVNDTVTNVGFEEVYVVGGVESRTLTQTQITSTLDVSLVDVPETRRWRSTVDGGVAGNQVILNAGDSVTVAMDFGNILAQYESISSVTSVTDQSANALVPTTPKVFSDRQRVNCDVTGLTSGATYQLRFTCVTSHANTKAMDGILKVA